jgi:2-haloacid dehalogenase
MRVPAHTPSAHAVNLKAAWINRPSAIMGVKGLEDIVPEYEFKSMEEFAGAYEKALGK